MTRQHVILCEGFDDRAFWAGWLIYLGCQDQGRRRPVYDAWGEEVKNGKYLFTTRGASNVLVDPVHGGSEVRATAMTYFRQHNTKPIGRMIVNIDSDAEGEGRTSSAREVIAGIVRDYDGGAVGDLDGPHSIDDVEVWPVVWECLDSGEIPGIPRQQTLERLAAAAIVAAYAERGEPVQRWLEAEPVEENTNHKNYGMSYFAKWYAQRHGHGDFYRALWRDEAVAEQLKARLTATGAWQLVEELVAD